MDKTRSVLRSFSTVLEHGESCHPMILSCIVIVLQYRRPDFQYRLAISFCTLEKSSFLQARFWAFAPNKKVFPKNLPLGKAVKKHDSFMLLTL